MIRGTTSEDMRDKAIEREERHAIEKERAMERLAAEAKACPFCAFEEPHIAEDIVLEKHYTSCDDCGAQGPLADTAEESVELWNNRPKTN